MLEYMLCGRACISMCLRVFSYGFPGLQRPMIVSRGPILGWPAHYYCSCNLQHTFHSMEILAGHSMEILAPNILSPSHAQ